MRTLSLLYNSRFCILTCRIFFGNKNERLFQIFFNFYNFKFTKAFVKNEKRIYNTVSVVSLKPRKIQSLKGQCYNLQDFRSFVFSANNTPESIVLIIFLLKSTRYPALLPRESTSFLYTVLV
jgi:hypothetical protein